MTDLIVDFPSEHERLSEKLRRTQESMPSATAKPPSPTLKPNKKRRSVHFSETSTMTIIERATPSEIARRWYSRSERAEFELRLRKDVRATMRRLESTPMHSFEERDLYECIGIELYLSRAIFMATPERRSNHVSFVLEAQSRHGDAAACRLEEELMRMSKQSSEWICRRCHNIAANYCKI